MSPKYELGTGVAWPDPLELDDQNPDAFPSDGLRAFSTPMYATIEVASDGAICQLNLDALAVTQLRDWLNAHQEFSDSVMQPTPDPGYVAPVTRLRHSEVSDD